MLEYGGVPNRQLVAGVIQAYVLDQPPGERTHDLAQRLREKSLMWQQILRQNPENLGILEDEKAFVNQGQDRVSVLPSSDGLTVSDLKAMLMRYAHEHPKYLFLRSNCQTFSVAIFHQLTGKRAVPEDWAKANIAKAGVGVLKGLALIGVLPFLDVLSILVFGRYLGLSQSAWHMEV